MSRSLLILGRQPAIGLAELESLYGSSVIQPFGQTALIALNPGQIEFSRLGGTIKLGEVLTETSNIKWPDIEKKIIEILSSLSKKIPEGKLKFGLSCYGFRDLTTKEIELAAFKAKKATVKDGRSTRVVVSRETELSSAQVIHNNLTKELGVELLVAQANAKVIFARTVNVQDISAYTARDQARPKRDAKVGMLPPKLAQIIINLAVDGNKSQYSNRLDAVQGAIEKRSKPYIQYGERASQGATPQSAKSGGRVSGSARKPDAAAITVLDPFCGTGVVLQEALLMGFNAYGTDLEPRLVEYSKGNLEWLKLDKTNWHLEAGDATNHQWKQPIGAVASETYLGQPYSSPPQSDQLNKNIAYVNKLLENFLKNLAKQINAGTRLCLAVPAWRFDALRSAHALEEKTHLGFRRLPAIDHLTDMGYTRLSFVHVKNEDLIYFREGQIVARELLVLTKD